MVAKEEKLIIEIVERNSEVLPILIRDIGKHLQSGEDVALIRFDAFADLLVPKDVPADEIKVLDHLIESINSHCWIFPAVYRGYVTKIFWFKPPWAHQFQDGKYELQVGKCQRTGVLKISSTNPYFTSNCVYLSSDKLDNLHQVDLYITTAGLAENFTVVDKPLSPTYVKDSDSESLDTTDTNDSTQRKKVKLEANNSDSNNNNTTASTENNETATKIIPSRKRVHALDANLLNDLLTGKPFLLDIDLTFFSTDDPVRKLLDENEYEVLRAVYTRIVQDLNDDEIIRYMQTREVAMEQIKTTMEEYIAVKPEEPIRVENAYLAALLNIIRYKKLDWHLIHNYGMNLSDVRPAYHVSSEEMVLYLLDSMTKILQSVKKPPVLITVDRSADDGYCTSDQSDMIQRHLERTLKKIYKIDETMGKTLTQSSSSSSLISAGEQQQQQQQQQQQYQKESIYEPTSMVTDIEATTKEVTPTVFTSNNTNNGDTSPSPPKLQQSFGSGLQQIRKLSSSSSLSESSPS